MLRRLGVLVSIVVVAVMFAGVSSAQAQTGITCIFSGLSGPLSPSIPPISGDLGLDVERGSYGFSSGGGTPSVPSTCGGMFNGVGVVGEVSITSTGFYDNVKCGTGTAHDLDGSGTVIAFKTFPIQIGPGEIGYEIPFRKGEGDLRIGDPAGVESDGLENLADDPARGDEQSHGGFLASGAYHSTTGLDSTHEGNSSNWTGEGEVQITPRTGNCVNVATAEFEVGGHFTMSPSP